MQAQITVTRTPGEIPHEITLSVELDNEGVVLALPVETVYRKFLNGGPLFYKNIFDSPIATEGFPFELEPDEIEEAKKAYDAQMRSDLEASLAKHEAFLGGISPLAGLNPPSK